MGAHRQFNYLQKIETIQELNEDLAPKIKKLKSTHRVLFFFYNIDILHNVRLTLFLNQWKFKSLPNLTLGKYTEKLGEFLEQDHNSAKSPAMFHLISNYIAKVEKTFNSYSVLSNTFIPVKVGIKPVC